MKNLLKVTLLSLALCASSKICATKVYLENNSGKTITYVPVLRLPSKNRNVLNGEMIYINPNAELIEMDPEIQTTHGTFAKHLRSYIEAALKEKRQLIAAGSTEHKNMDLIIIIQKTRGMLWKIDHRWATPEEIENEQEGRTLRG